MGSSTRRTLSVCLAFLTLVRPCVKAAGPRAQSPPEPLELFEQLNNVSVDPAEIYVLRGAQISRGGLKIFFNRGFVGFFTKVGSEVTGATFTGEGEVLLVPPSEVEKQNLARFSHSGILEERFTLAYLRFSDGTAQELLAKARHPEPEDIEQPAGFLDYWNPTVRRLSPDYSARILLDLLGDRTVPFFHARIQGVELGVFEVSDDERLPEAVRVGAVRRTRGNLYADIWCSFPGRASEERGEKLALGPAAVRSYKIDTRIFTDNSLEGRAELELESLSSVDRVLTFELSRQLKISEVRDEKGRSVALLQNPSLEESGAAARGNDWVVVVLASPNTEGHRFRLTFAYRGNVIADVGNGVLYVGAHGSWYPNLGLGVPASFDLTFHYPERLDLVATGERREATTSDGWKTSHWVSSGTFRVAGFNLGAYNSRMRHAGKTAIEVYATREVEAALQKRYAQAQPLVALPIRRPGDRRSSVVIVHRSAPRLDPSALLDGIGQSAAEALQYFETLFGPFPFPRLAISQIPGKFGQGWPELVYLPTLSFLTPAERAELGLLGKSEEWEERISVAHEIAHQWWGNELGWKTYHDQWLSEGFASYAAALYLVREKGGERKFRDLLREYKRDLLAKNPEGNTVESGGPIWLGQRLRTSLNPEGYEQAIYKKACWVLHMLRVLMTDRSTGSDERFFRMLRDFVSTYRRKSPSTEDFVRTAEKYMTPAMDLDHNRRLDWFFEDWVYGTGIPEYKLQVKTERMASDKFAVRGTIEQSGVSQEFEMLVPLIAASSSGKKVALGQVVVGSEGGRFRFTVSARPARVAIDEENLLAVVH